MLFSREENLSSGSSFFSPQNFYSSLNYKSIKKMQPTTVEISGTTTVNISSTAAQSMLMMEDPVLVHEITTEALKIAICEKLGGFPHVEISRPPIGDVSAPAKANINFDELTACIRRIVMAYDDLGERLETLKKPLAILENAADRLDMECKEAVRDIRQIMETAISLQEVREAEAAEATKKSFDHHSEKRNDDAGLQDEDSHSGDDDDSPEKYGYKPLLGDNDDDDDDDGPPAMVPANVGEEEPQGIKDIPY